MKTKKSLIIMSAAALALAAACSSEEPSTNGDGGIDNATAYLNVQIAMTSTSGSRAATDAGYVNGTPDEGKVESADFYLYDASGNYLAHSKVESLVDNPQADGSNVETKEDAVVPFGPMTITAGSNIYMITILNMSGDGSAFTSTLSTALEALTSTTLPKVAGSFEMSSSAYNDGSADLRYNVVPASKFHISSKDALGDPVEVYVERTVARVDIAYKENESTSDGTYMIGDGTNAVQVVLDGTTYDSLAVKVLGQKVNITNKYGYMIKNINNSTNYYYLTGTKGTDLTATAWANTSWSKSGDSRSYWAEDANYQTTKNDDLNIYSFNDINGQTAASEYVFENTVDHSVTGTAKEAVAKYARYAPGEDSTNVTTLCVVGQLGYYANSTFTELSGNGPLYRINGMFYTESYLKGLLANALSTSYNVDGNALSANDIVLTLTGPTATSNRAFIGVRTLKVEPNGVTIKDAQGDIVGTLDLTGTPYSGDVDVFLNGYCYYQVPIEQALDSSSTGTLYGVVRNHVYAITVNGVNKIGNPVYDPTQPLTPIPGDEQYYYLAAQINVLAWRKVTQSVTL